MTTATFIEFAGGIGLFLLGMKLMTDGLKVAAGQALRDILSRWTGRPLRGLAAGVLITAMVQSSSAVIFATIGFVNAGLLSLGQAVAVIYGSNLGTTVTSWLVAVVGFKLDLKALALPAIALGMLLRVSRPGTRWAALGEAMAGFGVFFLGIDVLKSTFAGVEELMPLQAQSDVGWLSLLPFVAIGVLLTVLMQSSSAALAVTLTAAAGGLIPLQAAAAVVIGANVGTTSTAAFAVIGATPSAKRSALAHVVFNLVTGAIAFLGLFVLLAAVETIMAGVGGQSPAIKLALFHTMTKLLGVATLWPLTPVLVRFLEARFRSADEDAGRPRHLDATVASTPALARAALERELERIGRIARDAATSALSAEGGSDRYYERELQTVDRLVVAMAEFTSRAQMPDMPHSDAEAFPQILRVTQYYGDMVERAAEIARLQSWLRPLDDAALSAQLAAYKGKAVHLIAAADPGAAGFAGAEAAEAGLAEFEHEYQAMKAALLRAGSAGHLPVRQMAARLDEIGAIRRCLDQAVKAARLSLSDRAEPPPAVAPEAEPAAEAGTERTAEPAGSG